MPTVRVAVIPNPQASVEIREVEEPQLELASALLSVDLSEVCGTDVHLQQGRLSGVPYPLIPGHVSVGRLAKIRGHLASVNGTPLREGDLVTFLDVHRTCNACWYCLVAKASTRCPQRRVYGITYGFDDVLAGGWAEKVYLKPATRVLPLAENSGERFMAGGCSLPTALHAVERAQIAIGDTVLVLGSGPVGLSAVILARMSGAGKVLCIGAPDSRLATASAVGADAVLNFEGISEDARRQWVLDRSGGRGADITIEATGAPAAVVHALRFTRDAGRVVIVGQYTDHGDVAINPHSDINRKHLDIRGCWGSDFSHFYRAVQLISDGERSRPWTKIPLARYSLNNVGDGLRDVAQGAVAKALVEPAR
jgi:L-iditol 2-dehydrogenase